MLHFELFPFFLLTKQTKNKLNNTHLKLKTNIVTFAKTAHFSKRIDSSLKEWQWNPSQLTVSTSSSSSSPAISSRVYLPATGLKDARSAQLLRVLSLNFFSNSLMALLGVPNGPFSAFCPGSPCGNKSQ